jgi:uncharacterized delta-60 repeat protein
MKMKLRNILLVTFGILAAVGNQASAQSAIDGFKPDVSGMVTDVELGQGRFKYIAGTFTQVNGTTRNNLARINHNGSLDTTYNPAPNSGVSDIAIKDNQAIVIGGFSTIGGGPSGGIARLNLNGTNDGTFTAAISGAVCVAIQADGKVVVGGHFTTVGGVQRLRLARFNTDGSLDMDFARNIGNSVFGVTIQKDGKILITGQFTTVDGQNRFYFARLNSNGTLDAAFGSSLTTPGGNGTTYASAVQPDGKIIVAGDFTRFGDLVNPRNRIVRLTSAGDIDTTFAPSFDGPTFDVKVQPDGKVLVGGRFVTVNGATRGGLARIAMNGAVDTTFVTNTSVTVPIDYQVNRIAIQPDGGIVIGGAFTQVNGFAGYNRLARVYPDGRLDADTVLTIVGGPATTMVSLPNGQTLLGGGFTNVGGAARQGMARIGWTGANDSSFANPQLTGWVYSIGVQKNGGYIAGGDFTSAGGGAQAKLARILSNGAIDGAFAPTFNAGAYINSVVIQPDGKIVIAGSFTTVNGISKARVARLNASGSLDMSFTANVDQPPLVMALQADGKILIGGYFENVGGVPHSALARLNSDGNVDSSFSPTIGGIPIHEVYEIAIDRNGGILVGGKFDSVNSVPRQNMARLQSSGTLDTTFVGPSLDGPVLKIVPDLNHSLYIAGRFLNIGGIPTPGIGQLTDIGQVVGFPNTGANDVLSMTIRSDNKILLSGYFTTVNGQPRAQFAALRGVTATGSEIIANPASLVWQRSPYDTEVMRAEFERSSDGVTYTPLGEATRGANSEWVLNMPNANATGYVRVRGYAGDFSVQKSVFEQVVYVQKPPISAVPFDFDGDGKTDIGIFRPTAGLAEWWINQSSTGQTPALQFGTTTDKIVPADYTGDGKADIAYFRPASGEWFVLRSENFSFYSLPFGTNGDIPAPGDYDGDGKADYAVFRPGSGTWFVSQSSGAGTRIFQFGINGDKPVVADYDGDGKADVGIFRPSQGEWWVQRSVAGLLSMQFGSGTDKPVQGDFTGDGKADVAFWRPSTGEWFIVRSENNSFYSFPFGANGDTPSPGDYDGDGKFDATVFRSSSATWYIGRTSAGTLIVQFGASTDKPIPNAYVP